MFLKDVKEGAYVQYTPAMERFVLSAGNGVKGEHTFSPEKVKT